MISELNAQIRGLKIRRQRKLDLLKEPRLPQNSADAVMGEIKALSELIDGLNALKKSELRRLVSPDGVYALNWDSYGILEVVQLNIDCAVIWLDDNTRGIKKAWFSRDMRAIFCLNYDGTMGVWSMLRPRQNNWGKDIIECLSDFNSDYEFKLRDFVC